MKSLLLICVTVIAFGSLSGCTPSGGKTPSLSENSAPTQSTLFPNNNLRNARTQSSTMTTPSQSY